MPKTEDTEDEPIHFRQVADGRYQWVVVDTETPFELAHGVPVDTLQESIEQLQAMFAVLVDWNRGDLRQLDADSIELRED